LSCTHALGYSRFIGVNLGYRHAVARWAWKPSRLPAWLSEEIYTNKIWPLLKGIANPIIMPAPRGFDRNTFCIEFESAGGFGCATAMLADRKRRIRALVKYEPPVRKVSNAHLVVDPLWQECDVT
jgi:hypothetical protein